MTTDEIIIALAEKLGRRQALTDQESRWLEASIRREQRRSGVKRGFWGKPDDRRLKRLLDRGKKVREIASLMGKTEDSVRSRIRVLRGNTGHRRPPEQGFVAGYGLGA